MVSERSGAFNTLEKPIKFINIEFDGIATILMSYLSIGDPRIDMPVIPIFQTLNPTYTIMDLSWVQEGTPEKTLPEGFSFGYPYQNAMYCQKTKYETVRIFEMNRNVNTYDQEKRYRKKISCDLPNPIDHQIPID